MSDGPERTNSMRMLDQQKVEYQAHYYSAEFHTAEEVAELVGFPPEQVFKTLVALPLSARPRPLLAIIPANRELDLKKLANACKEKKVRMAAHREAESLTGLQVGGISALALLHKRWRVYLDSSASAYPDILVSAGQRGINLQLSVADLVRITGAHTAHITRPPAQPPQ